MLPVLFRDQGIDAVGAVPFRGGEMDCDGAVGEAYGRFGDYGRAQAVLRAGTRPGKAVIRGCAPGREPVRLTLAMLDVAFRSME